MRYSDVVTSTAQVQSITLIDYEQVPSGQLFKCTICSETFSNISDLQEHMCEHDDIFQVDGNVSLDECFHTNGFIDESSPIIS